MACEQKYPYLSHFWAYQQNWNFSIKLNEFSNFDILFKFLRVGLYRSKKSQSLPLRFLEGGCGVGSGGGAPPITDMLVSCCALEEVDCLSCCSWPQLLLSARLNRETEAAVDLWREAEWFFSPTAGRLALDLLQLSCNCWSLLLCRTGEALLPGWLADPVTLPTSRNDTDFILTNWLRLLLAGTAAFGPLLALQLTWNHQKQVQPKTSLTFQNHMNLTGSICYLLSCLQSN